MNASAIVFAVQLARAEAESALPNAPVVSSREPSQSRPVLAVRSSAARALRLAADRLAPRTSPSCA